MPSENGYFDQAFPDTVTVLGQKLEPFSVGHLKILQAQGNKFVVGGLPSIEDFIFGVFVCCQTYAEAIKSINDPQTVRKMVKWGRRCRKLNFPDELTCFTEYIHAATTLPDVQQSESRSLGAPAPLTVQVALCSQLGYRPSEVMDKPWGEAVWEYVALLELKGDQKVFGDTEKRMFDLAEQMRKEMRDGV